MIFFFILLFYLLFIYIIYKIMVILYRCGMLA